ncbi:MAG: YcfL family protein [Plesiomonas sp.]
MRSRRAVGVLLCLLLAGCAGRGFTGFQVDQQPLVLADETLSQQVAVQSHRIGFGQPLRVALQLHNVQDQPLTLAYRLYWYDAQGIELDNDPAPWQQITLSAHQVWSRQITTQEPQARYYRLHLRPVSPALTMTTP